MKQYPCKLGTQPAIVRFRYKYKLRPGLKVQYQPLTWSVFKRDFTPESPWRWEPAIVDSIDPLFLSKV